MSMMIRVNNLSVEVLVLFSHWVNALCISFHLILASTYGVGIIMLLRKDTGNNLAKVTASELQSQDSTQECVAPRLPDSAEHQRPGSIPVCSTNQLCALGKLFNFSGPHFPHL